MPDRNSQKLFNLQLIQEWVLQNWFTKNVKY